MKARQTLSLAACALLAAACAGEMDQGGPDVTLGPLDGHDLPPVDTGRVAVGDVAPDFRLQSYDHGIVQLSDFRQRNEVVLVFYRGHW